MRITRAEFLRGYQERFQTKLRYNAALSYWKMKHLMEDGETFYLPEHDCYYMIRDKHLLIYDSPDDQMHLSIDALNGLDCISLPASIYDSVKERLIGFHASYAWRLRYDFNHRPVGAGASRYETVDFDFADQEHYRRAAAIISGGDINAFSDARVRKMTLYSAFDPSLWFFVKDKATGELAAISISEYEPEVRQTDLDWIFVAPEYQGKGCGRFLIEETIGRCKDKSEDICVAGTVDFYRKCGFVNAGLWVWAPRDGYKFEAAAITP